MRFVRIWLICLVLVAPQAFSMDGIQILFNDNLDNVQNSRSNYEVLISYPPDSLARIIENFKGFTEPVGTDTILSFENTISDTLVAPYHLYIPPNYDALNSTPLIVWMHGGVSLPDFENDPASWEDHPIIETCREANWLVLLPLGKIGVTWWDYLGMQNVMTQIREVKANYNIDDDRVVGCGFSDGGSGSFHFAMRAPTDFGVLFPWSGHPGVGSLVTNTPSYLTNLHNRTLYASNGGVDRLYPAAVLQPVMQLAIDDGADLNFTVYDTAGHNYGYMPSEFALFTERVMANPRHAFQPSLYWETSDLRYNRVDWLEITELDTLKPKSYWHEDLNYTMSSDRLTIGFNHDQAYEGDGVKVAGLVDDPDAPAVRMGLHEGDIVIAMNNLPTMDIMALAAAKDMSARGKDFTLTVKRDGKELVLKSAFPEKEYYKVFVRNAASGAVDVSRVGNDFYVRTSRIGAFRLYVHPDMVRLDQNVRVTVDGELRFDEKVIPDTRFMLDQFIQNRDRRLLWVNSIDIEI